MRKFIAVIKREYLQRVRTKFFVIATVLGPVMLALFTIVPVYIAGIHVGGPTRLAVVDQTGGKVYERFREVISRDRAERDSDDEGEPDNPASPANSNQQQTAQRRAQMGQQGFDVKEVPINGRALDQIKKDLNEQVRKNEIDGYLVIPTDVLGQGKAEFYGRNTGDVFTRSVVANNLTIAVREERLAEKNIDQRVLREANRRVTLNSTKISDRGEESVSENGFMMVFSFGMLIYISVLLYGQIVLGAVVEEKETRIAEVLFSSLRSFPLMMGKLIGVSLVALTQLCLWGIAFFLFSAFGVGMMAARGIPVSLPHVPAIVFVCFVLYFLLGYFLYATVYALVGSMVTTTQEGGQLALPVVLMLVSGFYFVVPILRSPNSSLAFWASMFPFLAPMTMMVRITTEMPPAWQIILSLGIGVVTIIGLIWVAARIYRVGMLMYGKKASIPEVWRWVRQA
jgi:ABC-2 type transport system permease protein